MTFNYVGGVSEDGLDWTNRTFYIVDNQRMPFFKVDDIQVDDGNRLVFRYWKLESGNLTSSLTMLSNMTFVAVYDSIVEHEQTNEEVVDRTKHLYEPVEQKEIEIGTCVYAKEIKPNSGKYICTFNRVNPKVRSEQKVIVNCPRMNELNIPFHEENDFGFGTILEISDISKLLNALFKVNIDIAHREYYLKKDIQLDTGWWYGQVM